MDREEMIAAEAARVETFYKSYERAFKHPFASAEDFVRFVVHRHEALFERWGGFRFPGPNSYKVEYLDEQAVATVVNSFLYNDPYRDFIYYGNHPVTGARGRKCPYPCGDAYKLYRSKLFAPLKGQDKEEHRYGYDPEAAQYLTAEFRKGQSTSRVILKDLQKRFPNEPEIHKMWNKFFEQLGHAWAGANAMTLTTSFAPGDLLHLGHMNADKGRSCYNTGGVSEYTKVNLCLYPNSSLIFIHRGDNALKPWEERGPVTNVEGRSWGFIQPGLGALFTNLYGCVGWTAAADIFSQFLSDAIGIPALIPVRSSMGKYSIGYRTINGLACDGDVHLFAQEKQHDELWKVLKPTMDGFSNASAAAAGREWLKSNPKTPVVAQEKPAVKRAPRKKVVADGDKTVVKTRVEKATAKVEVG